MKMDVLVRELTRDEGVRLKPYRCSAGKLTIGIGRNIQDRGISRTEAEFLLHNDCADVFADLDRLLPWWRDLDEVRQRALANMCFNLGIGRLLGFRNTLRHLEAGRYLEAAQSALASKWATQVGHRAERIAVMLRDGGDR